MQNIFIYLLARTHTHKSKEIPELRILHIRKAEVWVNDSTTRSFILTENEFHTQNVFVCFCGCKTEYDSRYDCGRRYKRRLYIHSNWHQKPVSDRLFLVRVFFFFLLLTCKQLNGPTLNQSQTSGLNSACNTHDGGTTTQMFRLRCLSPSRLQNRSSYQKPTQNNFFSMCMIKPLFLQC